MLGSRFYTLAIQADGKIRLGSNQPGSAVEAESFAEALRGNKAFAVWGTDEGRAMLAEVLEDVELQGWF